MRWVIVCGWMAIAATGWAQAANAGSVTPAYDVVTIRPSLPGGWRGDTDTNADSYLAHNVTLKAMLEDAYGIRQHLISGVPRALEDARFDLQAKVVDQERIHSLKDEQRPAMLLQVLEDRFRLKAHVEMKVLPIYDLVLARGGPKFKEATKESLENEDMEVRRRMLTATAQTMPDLANALTGVLNRTVLDETGLAGRYDFTMRWTPDGSDAAADVMAPPGIFDALEGQLGLRLRAARGEVKTLVVDEAEMPGEN
jgi:uncharacterized protein (TIGR03435 family)